MRLLLPLIVVGVLVLIATMGVVFYFRSRKLLREAKNYERGLKMVPLYIHMPPLSDDIDSGSRDNRDIVEENVSRAQALYGILANTTKKGFKSNFYGQRHISLEIIAVKGFVKFYTAVPAPLVSVIEQAVVGAYPSARLEEVSEHNIFSSVGKISGTSGGELVLKENFAYPIATYQDTKRDIMLSLLNALSTLHEEDGAGIQILIRPASSGWRKTAKAEASKKRKGQDSKKGGELAASLIKQLATAPFKPPEDTKPKDEGGKQLSTMDQALVDAIDAKTGHPGFEVLIRIVTSSNLAQRSQSVLGSIVNSFALLDAPGRNGFKFVPTKDVESFVTSFIMRFFPQDRRKDVLNSVELATLFHFPDQSNIPTTQLERQLSKQVDGPRNISDEGVTLGYNIFRGAKKRINIAPEDRLRHMYVIGQTGTGKSQFIFNLAVQDMLNGEGFAYIDPHGDDAVKLLGMVPRERAEDVIYFCPADMDYPLGLNLFDFRSEEEKDFLIQESLNMLYKIYDPNRQGIIGPRFERIFTNAALLLMSDPAGGTFVDIPKLLVDPEFMKSKLKYVTDQNVLDFWTKEWPNSQRSSEAGEITSWVVSKFGAFQSNELMRNIIGQTKSAFDMREIMDNKKILIVNLSKGRTGELNAKLLGMMFVMKFQAAAMSRANIDEKERVPFSLYVDEFQNFATDSFASILSEARKFRLSLIVANQFIGQLTNEIRDAVFGNVGTVAAFRIGTDDAEYISKQLAPVFDADDLQRMPNWNCAVKMLIKGFPTQPFSMATLPPFGEPNKQLIDALKQLSSAKYARPRGIVGSEISERLFTKTVPIDTVKSDNSPLQNSPFLDNPQFAQRQMPNKASFLDEWLAKRKIREGNTNNSSTNNTKSEPPESDDSKSSSVEGGDVAEITSASDELVDSQKANDNLLHKDEDIFHIKRDE